MSYIRLLWEKAYLGLLIVLLCACFGSVRGAIKESREPFIGVTQEDLSDMEAAGDNAPEMVGVIALAVEQNRWRNFSYAAHYAVRGVAVYCMLMAAYLPLYHCRGFKAFRALFEKDTGGSDVFD